MTTAQPVLKGSCRCGGVTYTSTYPTDFTNCHCQTCRKLSGGPFIAFASVSTSSFTIASRPGSLKTTKSSDIATRTHCGDCGSPIGMQYMFEPETFWITASSIDEGGAGMRPSAHIFLSEKAEWYEVPNDGVLRIEGFPEVFGARLEDWKKGLEDGKA